MDRSVTRYQRLVARNILLDDIHHSFHIRIVVSSRIVVLNSSKSSLSEVDGSIMLSISTEISHLFDALTEICDAIILLDPEIQ